MLTAVEKKKGKNEIRYVRSYGVQQHRLRISCFSSTLSRHAISCVSIPFHAILMVRHFHVLHFR